MSQVAKVLQDFREQQMAQNGALEARNTALQQELEARNNALQQEIENHNAAFQQDIEALQLQ